ncbi:hypothetical protein E2562_037229 [Oryza meyeriana var. granulata]|uniref:Uncharacterized protein n=1 Tax=Oryza meyeriana var. granulata TaxID=110450 RepID=A0A6G1ETT5_9ORYZ|nr:hypothetical protein E2562_037229 [Oryza meyeriana var. granulata]
MAGQLSLTLPLSSRTTWYEICLASLSTELVVPRSIPTTFSHATYIAVPCGRPTRGTCICTAAVGFRPMYSYPLLAAPTSQRRASPKRACRTPSHQPGRAEKPTVESITAGAMDLGYDKPVGSIFSH